MAGWEDDEVTLLPDDDDYASPERACEMEDFPPPICAVEPNDKKSNDDSKYPEEMSAIEPDDKKSNDDSKYPEEMSAVESDDKKSDDDSKYPEEMSAIETEGIKPYYDSEDSDEIRAIMYNIKSYYDSEYPENMSAVEPSGIKSYNDSKYPAKMSAMEPRDIKSYDDSKCPALSKSHRVEGISLSSLRKMCDFCMELPHYRLNRGAGGFDPRDLLDLPAGGAVTHINAGKRLSRRNLVDVALKFYNGTKSKNFKLVKVCKVNCVAGSYNGVTFRAQEDGSEESPLF